MPEPCLGRVTEGNVFMNDTHQRDGAASARNTAIVQGTVAADATVTELADGSTVHNFDLRSGDTSVPVAWYDPSRPPKLVAGAEMVVVGRVRRRWFRAGGGSQSRTEVVAVTVAKPGSARAVRAVARAADRWASEATEG